MAEKRIDIWNDNIDQKNYRMFFDKPEDGAPGVLTLAEKDDDKNNPPNNWEVEFVGKEYVDKGDQTLQVQINNLDTRMESAEEKNDEQDTRLDDIEEKDEEQDDRLDLIEAKNTEQDDRLEAIDGVNGTQSGRLNDLETRVTEAEKDIDTLIEDVNTIEVEISDDICKLVEYSSPYSVEDFPIGMYRVKANLRINLSAETEVIPVMGIMVVNVDSNVKETYFNMQRSDVTRGNVADVNVTYFQSMVDMSALLNRETYDKGFTSMEITDFTYDRILVSSDRDDGQDMRMDNLQSQIDTLNRLFNLRGAVRTYSELPVYDNIENDGYIVMSDETMEGQSTLYIWTLDYTGTGRWTFVGEFKQDLNLYYTKTEIDAMIATISTKFGDYLPLTGGTLSGPLAMSGRDLTGVGSLTLHGWNTGNTIKLHEHNTSYEVSGAKVPALKIVFQNDYGTIRGIKANPDNMGVDWKNDTSMDDYVVNVEMLRTFRSELVSLINDIDTSGLMDEILELNRLIHIEIPRVEAVTQKAEYNYDSIVDLRDANDAQDTRMDNIETKINSLITVETRTSPSITVNAGTSSTSVAIQISAPSGYRFLTIGRVSTGSNLLATSFVNRITVGSDRFEIGLINNSVVNVTTTVEVDYIFIKS